MARNLDLAQYVETTEILVRCPNRSVEHYHVGKEGLMNARTAGFAALVLVMGIATARAQDGFGVGIILGEPTGITVKQWISPEHAIDAAAGWSFLENDSVQLHADYLFHNFGLLKTDPTVGRLPVYVGIGGRVKLEDDDGTGRNNNDDLLGIRVPLGIAYRCATAPVDIFLEIVPVLDVVPDSDFDINAAIGARFYFR